MMMEPIAAVNLLLCACCIVVAAYNHWVLARLANQPVARGYLAYREWVNFFQK